MLGGNSKQRYRDLGRLKRGDDRLRAMTRVTPGTCDPRFDRLTQQHGFVDRNARSYGLK
jgi:hypothetical protein